ncbi:hypothetical protein MKK88_25675 [Methylobacterium sp. E-005]|uniref:hypothetical protein n=1 Tax=Methylobacterium sp. E-005 TaxID=2836549 RepID=UPI001FBAB16F|nr:hypothetical protein [Methylobacterium sp. E-005]MCJ2089353.1 hypothetical protein [Methylobacterium sp. E-005]
MTFLLDTNDVSELRTWMDSDILPEFAARVLPVDAAGALCCAGLHAPDPGPGRDALIAATAMVHAMTAVTRNSADFVPTGVRIVKPWQVASSTPRG